MGKVVGRCGDSGVYCMTEMMYDSEGSTLALKPRADINRVLK